MNASLRDLGFESEQNAADLFGVKVETLRNWRYRETGPAYVKIGNSIVYRKDDLVRHLQNRRHVPRNA